MGIRIELIRSKYTGRYCAELFKGSRNPILRAHAAVAKFSKGDLTVPELAQAMIEDCLLPNFNLNYRAADVFRTHLSKYRLNEEEKEEIGNVFLEKADQHGEIFIQPAKIFLIQMNIDPKIYFFSSTTAPFLQ